MRLKKFVLLIIGENRIKCNKKFFRSRLSPDYFLLVINTCQNKKICPVFMALFREKTGRCLALILLFKKLPCFFFWYDLCIKIHAILVG